MSEKVYEQTGVAMTCRSYAEYERMFALRHIDLNEGPILDVAAGASSFVAEASARGFRAQAADPLYGMDPDAIQAHGQSEIESSTQKLAGIREVFDWSYYGSLERHRELREQSLRLFMDDFRKSAGAGKYTPAGLPELPFDNDSFSLVLCSHFLFLYNDMLGESFHLQAIRELLRVGKRGGRVLIYPLHSLRWVRYPQLDSLLSELRHDGVAAEMGKSELPFIPGSTEFLCLRK
ncbi:class I SAM-dependent methyltransferase [Paenibacillus sp. NPDC056579]|uniref:class I SAM-dependent methyltransferase n=1 Tax=unclassified Paenibacillus TaxID=185978 RepID=UPI001EF7BD70|nr:class I SAM-dependent methyltransferase [Paenibacillus sp. H1-7]ULL14626.1 methylase [Paenibacillus sp. H1-7]